MTVKRDLRAARKTGRFFMRRSLRNPTLRNTGEGWGTHSGAHQEQKYLHHAARHIGGVERSDKNYVKCKSHTV